MEFSWNGIVVSAGCLPMAHSYPFERASTCVTASHAC